MTQIEPDLLLGSMSDVLYLLGRTRGSSTKTPTHLLSILNRPIDWSQIHTPSGSITAKLLVAPDIPTTDLLSHFLTCVSFITDALKDNGTVLVHCEYGISRSSTIVLAYLMKVKRLNFTQAFDFLKEKKPDIRPNSGFVRQLKLWYSMSYTLDENNKIYKAYKLHHQAREMKEVGYVSSMDMSPDPITSGSSIRGSYSCRKCRRTLFTDKDTLQHQLGKGFTDKRQHALEDFWSTVLPPSKEDTSLQEKEREEKEGEERSDDLTVITGDLEKVTVQESQRLLDLKKLRSEVAHLSSAASSHDSHVTSCSSLFIEPVEWMGPLIVGHKDGKLLCPKCTARVGSFDWAGSQCSCGRWVTPSFQIHRSKIDFKL